jgi:transposase-like protein
LEIVTTPQRIAQRFSEILEAKTPIAALRAVTALRRDLDAFERQQVARALADGATFASIARELGISRQAVHRRFRNLSPADAPLVTSPDARRVLLYARDEAIAFGSETPTSEHVLLATLRISELPAAAVLRAAGVTFGRVRAQVEGLATRGRLFRRDPAAEDFRALLKAPARHARERGSARIEVEDLLLGMLEDERGGAARTLRALGVDPEAVRDALVAILESRRA